VEYYLYALQMLSEHKINSEETLKWFDAVDDRSRKVEKLLTATIEPLGRVKFEKIALIDPIRDYVREKVGNNQKPDFDKVLSILTDNGPRDGIKFSWNDGPVKQNIDKQVAERRADPWVALNRTGWTLAEIVACKVSDGACIAIENQEEIPIIENAGELAKSLKQNMKLTGVLSQRKILDRVSSDRHNADIYLSKCFPQVDSIERKKLLVEALQELYGVGPKLEQIKRFENENETN